MQILKPLLFSCLYAFSVLIPFLNCTFAQETQRQKQEQNSQQNQYRDQAQATQQDQQQQSSQSYAGKVSEKYGKFYLEVAPSRSSYLLENVWQAKRFVNKKVRVTGSLDADKNILHVVTISLAP